MQDVNEFVCSLKQIWINCSPTDPLQLKNTEKVILSESGEKYAQMKHYLQAETV